MGMILICVASAIISDFWEIEKTPKRQKTKKSAKTAKREENIKTKKTKEGVVVVVCGGVWW